MDHVDLPYLNFHLLQMAVVTIGNLQQRNMDLHNARDRLAESFSSIQNLRNDYINIVKYARLMYKMGHTIK